MDTRYTPRHHQRPAHLRGLRWCASAASGYRPNDRPRPRYDLGKGVLLQATTQCQERRHSGYA